MVDLPQENHPIFNYSWDMAPAGSYEVAPGKSPLQPGDSNISTLDVIAVQQHYLNIAALPPGCALLAADVTGDNLIDTFDVIAIQRFFLGRTFGTGNVGHYQFIPIRRNYDPIGSDQSSQDYQALLLADVVRPFAKQQTIVSPIMAPARGSAGLDLGGNARARAHHFLFAHVINLGYLIRGCPWAFHIGRLEQTKGTRQPAGIEVNNSRRVQFFSSFLLTVR